jgi:Na+-transporting NADH:ubiquinone oxidoreductase subunit B
MEKLYQIWKKFGKNFEEGGKLSWLSSFYDAFDTFLFTPQTTAKRNGTHIHDGSDSKRTMILVVMALVPAMLFGMFNVGYQHLLATGQLAAGMTCASGGKPLASVC